MRFITIFTFIFLCFTSIAFSQKTIKHTVVEGESFYSIAKKYKVTESDIYELNPKAKGTLLQLKTVLLIPNKNYKAENKKKKVTSKNVEATEFHIVEAGESLYKIAKQHGISLDKLKELNPDIKPEAIQIGDKITVLASKKEIATITPKKEETPIVATTTVEIIPIDCEDELGNKIHTVQKGETLYKIAKKYKIKLNDLKELNEEVVENLPEGYQLIIKLGTVELANQPKDNKELVDVKPLSLENMSKAEFLIAKASEHIGTRYRGGGTTSAGFDCSGLMFATFKHIDMTLPRSSGSMAVGAGVRIDRAQAQKGDLIFFTTNGRGSINHVGMITEVLDDEIKFIHSSVQSGVIISSTKEPYYSRRFVQINRVLAE
ncbi:peptidoglycan endopeptidase [Flavobacterium celericrescens]|uniref:LysM peptidoglycan-binding domain-containing protein n=1 Tax=Flavobacterium celericrescens TaxID=2709780 RepID=A0ABX0IDG4_9FLAO|nr:peptidoglycan endopeptidase [Flavobacterium celericrescens]NHM03914.1 LysM peptidoglycan-binding domain-containing protein [Flavobacterium celericrescens]